MLTKLVNLLYFIKLVSIQFIYLIIYNFISNHIISILLKIVLSGLHILLRLFEQPILFLLKK